MSKPNTLPSTVTDPEIVAKRVEDLHADALFDEGDVVLGPMSEQHYLLGLAALEQAKAHFTLANYFAVRKD